MQSLILLMVKDILAVLLMLRTDWIINNKSWNNYKKIAQCH